jgi:ATP-dependent protease ClpP protease subunit
MPQPIDRAWQIEARATGKKKLEIAVHDVIGQSFFEDGITSKKFLAHVRSMPDAQEIDLRINSIGGIVDEAKGMLSILAERAGVGVTITGYVDGIAASAASYLLTGCSRVVMPGNTFQMLHQCRGGARGTADEIEAHAVLMRRMNEQLAEGYAAASARRGKGKTKEDFLALFAQGDTYLDADESLEWGLADEKLAALEIAASLVDLVGFESAPEAARIAPYVAGPTAKLADPTPTPPSPEARETNLPATGKGKKTMKSILAALALQEDADEATVVAAIKKIQASGRTGDEVERLLGVAGDSAIGAVRALKEATNQNADLAIEVGKVKAMLSRRDFESARDTGLKDRKLTPATAKMYSDRFEAALVSGADGASVVADLQGFLAVAPRVVPAPSVGRQGGGESSGEKPAQHNGKTFAQMAPVERARLSKSDPELYDLMRQDWVAAGKPAA